MYMLERDGQARLCTIRSLLDLWTSCPASTIAAANQILGLVGSGSLATDAQAVLVALFGAEAGEAAGGWGIVQRI